MHDYLHEVRGLASSYKLEIPAIGLKVQQGHGFSAMAANLAAVEGQVKRRVDGALGPKGHLRALRPVNYMESHGTVSLRPSRQQRAEVLATSMREMAQQISVMSEAMIEQDKRVTAIMGNERMLMKRNERTSQLSDDQKRWLLERLLHREMYAQSYLMALTHAEDPRVRGVRVPQEFP